MPEALPAGRTAHESERRRLAYVALTRARRFLVLSVPDVGEDGRGPVSRFVEEIIEALPGAPILEKGDAPEEVAGLERVAERRAAFEDATLRAARAEASGEEATAELRGHALDAAAALITARADAIARRPVTAAPYGTPKASGPISISPNAIVTYLTCPRRYRYAQVDKIRIPSGPAAAIGTAAHHALEAHYTPGSEPQSAEVLIERFARKLDDAGIAETAEAGQALHRAREHFPGYHRRVLAGGPPARVEYAFTLKAGQHSVHGRIDRVDFAGDGYRVIDYKTNRPPMQTDSGNTVLALYIAALGQTSKRPIVGARLDYILDGENRPVEPDAAEVEEAVRSAERVGDQVLAGAFDPAPGWHCNHCPYRLICPAQDR